ncbi:hypothetical protein J7K93_13710 [bacterium]|nr:hypothetical protein [bacterium]
MQLFNKLLFKINNRVLSFIIVFFLVPVLFAGDYGASFLRIGVGPRALGMGSAFCSLSDDASSFFWNPAGYGLLKKREAAEMYGPQFGTIADPMANFNAISIGIPLKNNATIAVNWVRLAIDDIPLYGDLSGNSYYERLHNLSLRPTGEKEGSISDAEDAIIFSFAKLNTLRIDLGWIYNDFIVDVPFGVNFKWIHQALGEYKASGFSIDGGVQFRIDMGKTFDTQHLGVFSLGLFLRDMTGLTVGWNTNHRDVVPASLVCGLSQSIPVAGKKNYLTISYDYDNQWSGEKRFGIEFSGGGVFALRAGVNGNGFTAGAGIKIWKFHCDYAFLSHELNNLHRVGCRVNF